MLRLVLRDDGVGPWFEAEQEESDLGNENLGEAIGLWFQDKWKHEGKLMIKGFVYDGLFSFCWRAGGSEQNVKRLVREESGPCLGGKMDWENYY